MIDVWKPIKHLIPPILTEFSLLKTLYVRLRTRARYSILPSTITPLEKL